MIVVIDIVHIADIDKYIDVNSADILVINIKGKQSIKNHDIMYI